MSGESVVSKGIAYRKVVERNNFGKWLSGIRPKIKNISNFAATLTRVRSCCVFRNPAWFQLDTALSSPSKDLYTSLSIKRSIGALPRVQASTNISRNEAAAWLCCIDYHLLYHQSTRCLAATRSFSLPFRSRKNLIWSLSAGGRNAADLLHMTITASKKQKPLSVIPIIHIYEFQKHHLLNLPTLHACRGKDR